MSAILTAPTAAQLRRAAARFARTGEYADAESLHQLLRAAGRRGVEIDQVLYLDATDDTGQILPPDLDDLDAPEQYAAVIVAVPLAEIV